MKDSCEIKPCAKDGNPSRLFIQLEQHFEEYRDLAKIVYATYLATANQVSFPSRYRLNKQGEHELNDLLNFWDINKIYRDSFQQAALKALAVKYGVMNEKTGEYIIFQDLQDALNKSIAINSLSTAPDEMFKGITAEIVQDSQKTGYRVVVKKKTIESMKQAQKQQDDLLNPVTPQAKAQAQQILSQELSYVSNALSNWFSFKDSTDLTIRVSHLQNIDALLSSKSLLRFLEILEKAGADYANKEFLLSEQPININEFKFALTTLFKLATNDGNGNNNKQIERLIQKGKSLEGAVQLYLNWTMNKRMSKGTKALCSSIYDFIEDVRYSISLTKSTLEQAHPEITSHVNTLEEEILDVLQSFPIGKKLSKNTVETLDSSLQNVINLKTAVQHGIASLDRLLKQLRREQKTITPQNVAQSLSNQLKMEHLYNVLIKVQEDLDNARNYNATVTIIQTLLETFKEMENEILVCQQQYDITKIDTEDLSNIAPLCKLLLDFKNLYDGSKTFLESVIVLNPQTPANVGQLDPEYLKHLCEQLQSYNTVMAIKFKELQNNLVASLLESILHPDKVSYAQCLAAATMIQHEATIWDLFYSIASSADLGIVSIGAIIRRAQDKRNTIMADLEKRVNIAETKLKKAGIKNTRWMYERCLHKHLVPYEDPKTGELKYVLEDDPTKPFYMVISDRDWGLYYFKKKSFRANLINDLQAGKINQLEFDAYMQDWIKNNTDEVVVDATINRTERIPTAKLYLKDVNPLDSLNAAQREYYDTIMQIKGEIGSMLPSYTQHQFRAVQERKKMSDVLFANNGHRRKITSVWKHIQGIWKTWEDDLEIGDNGTFTEGHFKTAPVNLKGEILQQIPIMYINPLKDQDEILLDFSGSIMSLAGTATNYMCISEIEPIVLYMSDALAQRKPYEYNPKDHSAIFSLFKAGNDFLKQKIPSVNTLITQQGILEKYLRAHLYGKYLNKSKGNKLGRSIISYTSISALAVNLPGATANFLVGEGQMLIEAFGGQYYGVGDYIWAHGKLLGETFDTPARLMDFCSGNTSTKAGLIRQLFDYRHEMFQNAASKRYYSNPLQRILSMDYTYALYGMGEEIIHAVNMYAYLHAVKVYDSNDKKVSLYDALHVVGDESTKSLSWYGYYYYDKLGNKVEIDDAFIQDKIRVLRYINKSTHGAIYREERGVLAQTLLGRFVLNLRQWMVEHYSRRFRKLHYDEAADAFVEGFHRTLLKYIFYLVCKIHKRELVHSMRWSTLSSMEKANIRRAATEDIMLLIGMILDQFNYGMGSMSEIKRNSILIFILYQLRRFFMEIQGSVPLYIVPQGSAILNNPIAAATTITNTLYILLGLKDIGKTVKSGKYRGMNLYLYNLLHNTVPFYHQIYRTTHLDESLQIFRYIELF